MLDFGKIIIYTSNLRIIRAPPRKPEGLRHRSPSPADREGFPRARERGSRRRARAKDEEEKRSSDAETKVMILGQIIPSGVLEVFFFFFSPALTFFLLRLQPAFLSYVSCPLSTSEWRPCIRVAVNLRRFTAGYLFSSHSLLRVVAFCHLSCAAAAAAATLPRL